MSTAQTPTNTTHIIINNNNMQLRFVAGCVPILLAPFYNNPLQRIRDCPAGDSDCLNRVDLTDSRFLFINSRKNPGKFVFPKGGVKKREDAQKAALRETMEETGVEGEIFDTLKRPNAKWFLLSVKKVHDDWLEKDQRERIWVPYEDIKKFGPTTKDTKKLIKKIKHLYKNEHDDSSDNSSSSDSDWTFRNQIKTSLKKIQIKRNEIKFTYTYTLAFIIGIARNQIIAND